MELQHFGEGEKRKTLCLQVLQLGAAMFELCP